MGALVVLFDHNDLLVRALQVAGKPPSHATPACDNDLVNRYLIRPDDVEKRPHVGRPPDAVDRVLDLERRVSMRHQQPLLAHYRDQANVAENVRVRKVLERCSKAQTFTIQQAAKNQEKTGKAFRGDFMLFLHTQGDEEKAL